MSRRLGMARYRAKYPPKPMAQRLRELGFGTYDEYLRSAHWRGVRQRYRDSPDHLHECYICGNPHYQLHHRTYVRLGREQLRDFIPLCGTCHRAVHATVRRTGGRLFTAAKEMRLARRGDTPPTKRPTAKANT